ncbi:hypothetical protein [Virgibacillus sp. 6R]|uniref:hypothetical protein n=1 Tax=Virgibacillus sp. 6R TaxID=1911587 RepID=UPI0018DB9224|nr:hypothetical protein [Virgibacillus sp. 6R]
MKGCYTSTPHLTFSTLAAFFKEEQKPKVCNLQYYEGKMKGIQTAGLLGFISNRKRTARKELINL